MPDAFTLEPDLEPVRSSGTWPVKELGITRLQRGMHAEAWTVVVPQQVTHFCLFCSCLLAVWFSTLSKMHSLVSQSLLLGLALMNGI